MFSAREAHASAVQHHQAGNLQQAMDLCRQIIEAEPDHVDALHLLGFTEYQLERHESAIEHLGAAARLRPNLAEAHNNLGAAFLARGQREEALASFRQAVQLKPNYPVARKNLGNVLRLQEKYAEALPHLQEAIRLAPRYAGALTCLGLVLRKLGRPHEALSYHQRALAIQPDSAEVLNDLGSALTELKRQAEAVPHYERALAIQPDLASAHHNLGIALLALNRPAEAVACHQKAIDIDPQFADAYYHLGNSLRTLGHIGEARSALEKALALAPQRTDYFYHLAESHRFSAEDPLLATMEALDKQTISADQRLFLHFGLGKVYTDLDRPKDALRHLCEGNRLHRQRIQYHETATLAVFRRISSVFTAEMMRAKAGLGDTSAAPIFIVGMPRSGSTLLEQVLSSHPGVFGAGEIATFIAVASRIKGLDARLLEHFRAAMEALTGEQLRSVGAEYVRQVRELAPEAERIVNKTLGNFFVVGLIHLALPNARILHMRRDPVDTCLSCFSKWFATEQHHTFDLAELGHYYREYEDLMEHWRRVLPPGVMIDVQYEDLVEDLEPQARRIIAHCGLEWDSRCLDFHRSERPVNTASAAQVRQPIYRSSLGRGRAWKDYLQPLLEALEGSPKR